MSKFIVYESITGKIIRSGQCPDHAINAQAIEAGTEVIEGSAFNTVHYVSSGSVVDRPVNNASIDKTVINADGIDSLTVSLVPNPSEYYIQGPVYTTGVITDGQLTFSTDSIGVYLINILSFPEQDKTIVVKAT